MLRLFVNCTISRISSPECLVLRSLTDEGVCLDVVGHADKVEEDTLCVDSSNRQMSVFKY